MQENIQKIFFDFEIISFELVALDTLFYWQRILVIECQYVNSLNISDTTKMEYFELILFLNAQKIWQKYWRENLRSVWDLLTCWLSISVLTWRFVGI